MTTKIYLVVLESDKTSVTTASFDQFTAQKLCHLYAKQTKIKHAVITEDASKMDLSVIKALCKKSPRFNKEFNKEG